MTKAKKEVEVLESPFNRRDWDTYFLRIAKLVAQRSTCMRNVGAVIIRENRIRPQAITAPNGITHCFQRKDGCLRESNPVSIRIMPRFTCEQNAILQASAFWRFIKNSGYM